MKSQVLSIAVVGILFSACTNPYRTNFNPTVDRFPAWAESRLAPFSGKPRLTETDDIKNENWRLFEKGYVMIGYSKFDGPRLDTELALKEARSRQADVVLLEKKFSKTLTETATSTYWPPNETTEVREERRSTGGTRGDRQSTRRTEITTSRGPETVYLPKQTDYYEYSATYWRKIEKPIFGALAKDLSDDEKKTLQSNRGLSVKAVMIGSPAYELDLLKGDIIVQMNGKPVSGAATFYEDLRLLAGKEVEFSIQRGKNKIVRRVTLNQ